MKELDDVYADTESLDSLSIGSAENAGQLTVNSVGLKLDKGPRPITREAYASFHYDGSEGELTVGAHDRVLHGKIKVGPTASGQAILLAGEDAKVQIGSKEKPGELTVFTPVTLEDGHQQEYAAQAPGFHYDGDVGTLSIGDVQTGVPGVIKVGVLSTRACIQLDSQSASMTLGMNGLGGNVTVRDRIGQDTIVLDGDNSTITINGASSASSGNIAANLILKKADGSTAISINSGNASITCGGDGGDGDLFLKNASNITTITLDGDNAKAIIGSQGVDGNLLLRDSLMVDVITLGADDGDIICGANGKDGDLFLRNAVAQTTVHIDGANGNVTCGSNGSDGDLLLQDADGNARIHLDGGTGNIRCGGSGADGDLILEDASGHQRIHLDGATGDIKLTGADFAEDFDIHDMVATAVKPGMVMVIARDGGTLEPCNRAYDKRVAGIVSGAGGYNPGIIMDKQPSDQGRLPVALTGKVYCMVDASFGVIETGDLLTTSPTPGHAMRVSDQDRAFGAVIGKAMTGAEGGCHLVPVLVALQ